MHWNGLCNIPDDPCWQEQYCLAGRVFSGLRDIPVDPCWQEQDWLEEVFLEVGGRQEASQPQASRLLLAPL